MVDSGLGNLFVRYASALMFGALAILFRWLLDPWLGSTYPLVAIFGAVGAAVWFSGYLPAIVTALASFGAASYLFIEPRGVPFPTDAQAWLGFLVFAVSCALIIGFGEGMRRATQRAREHEHEIQQRQLRLEQEIENRQDAETRLIHANSRIATILESITDAFYVVDREWRYAYINPQAESYFQQGKEALIGKVIWEIFPHMRGTVFEERYRLALDTGTAAHFEARSPKHGRFLEVHAYPTEDGLSVFFRDITELREAAEALRRSEERFRLAAEAVNGVIYDIDVPNNRIEYTRGLLRILGYRPEEISNTIAWWQEQIHPDDLPVVRRETERMLEHGDWYDIEFRVRHRDGRWIHIMDRGLVLRDASGKIVRTVGCYQDITHFRFAQDALKRSEERFRSLISLTTSIIWVTDPQGRIVAEQPSWSAYTGQSWPQYRDDGWLNGLHPDDRARVSDEWQRARSDSSLLYAEVRVWHAASGAYRHCEARGVPIRNVDGTLREWVGMYVDVEETKQREQRLRESEAKFRSLFDLGVVPMAFWHADGRILEANDAYLRLTGHTRDELANGELSWGSHVAPGQLTHFSERALMELQGTGYCTPFENVYQLKDGRRIPVLVGGCMLPGHADVGIGFALDLSERERAEEQLYRASQRLKSFISNTPLAVVEWDRDFHIVDWAGEAEKIFGWSAGEALGKTTNDLRLVYEEDRQAVERVAQALTNPANRHVISQNRNYTKEGRIIHCEWYSSILTDEKGNMEGALSLVLDVTERKRLESELHLRIEELDEGHRRKDEFLALLAHELRNPLAPIRNSVEVLRTPNLPAAALQNARAIIDRQVQQMARLIDDLMDVSRISRGKINLKKERVSLALIVMNAIEASRPFIKASRHELIMQLPQTPVYLNADVIRLSQVFLNLLNNAAKYTPPGGRITLMAERDGPDVVVMVRDTGIGIPAEHLPDIFDMFTQVDRSLERQQGGLGIGLTLVRRLVEMHGGKVEAHSMGTGTGSEFMVRLPTVQEPASEPISMPQVPEEEPRSAGCKIVVVDDNKDSAESLAMILNIMGHEVSVAHDGIAAVEAVDKHRPDIVLLDIGLPRLNGYDAARRIRSEVWGKDITLVALTGWGQESDKNRAAEAGFDYHLTKPVDPDTLEKILANVQRSAA